MALNTRHMWHCTRVTCVFAHASHVALNTRHAPLHTPMSFDGMRKLLLGRDTHIHATVTCHTQPPSSQQPVSHVTHLVAQPRALELVRGKVHDDFVQLCVKQRHVHLHQRLLHHHMRQWLLHDHLEDVRRLLHGASFALLQLCFLDATIML